MKCEYCKGTKLDPDNLSDEVLLCPACNLEEDPLPKSAIKESRQDSPTKQESKIQYFIGIGY